MFNCCGSDSLQSMQHNYVEPATVAIIINIPSLYVCVCVCESTVYIGTQVLYEFRARIVALRIKRVSKSTRTTSTLTPFLSTKYTFMVYGISFMCYAPVYIIVFIQVYRFIALYIVCMYIWYIISLALTKIFIFKEATRNHIKFFFRFFLRFLVFCSGCFFFFSIHKKRATRSYLLFTYPFDNLLLLYMYRRCVCVLSMQYMCVNNKPIAQWRENLVRLHLPTKTKKAKPKINKCTLVASCTTNRYPVPPTAHTL